MGVVYKATNKINNKIYVGQTILLLDKRIYNHYTDAFKIKDDGYYYGHHFYRALRKYKKKDWKWEIVYDNITNTNLGLMEIWAIAKHDSFRNGYNSTEGGEIPPSVYLEVRKKISKAKKGKSITLSKELRKRMSDRMSGENNHMYGTKMPKEHKEKLMKINVGRFVSVEERLKMSAAGRGRKKSKEHVEKIKNGIRVTAKKKFLNKYGYFYIIRNGRILGEFGSNVECAEKFDLQPGLILKCLKEERRRHKGFVFIKVDKYDKENI